MTSSQAFTSYQTLEMFRLSAMLSWLWLWWNPGVCVLMNHLCYLQGTAIRDKPGGWEENWSMCLCSKEKMPREKHALESLPSHQTCYQTLSCSSPPTWSTKPNPNQRTKQPTNQETIQSFTEISTSVCVLQANLLVHKKHSSTHKQASECNYSLWDCQVSMYYLKSKKNLKMLDDTSTSKKTDLCFKSWKKILFYFLKRILCKNLRCSHLN